MTEPKTAKDALPKVIPRLANPDKRRDFDEINQCLDYLRALSEQAPDCRVELGIIEGQKLVIKQLEARIAELTPASDIPGLRECNVREAFENWVKTHNQAEIKWIGHSYANAYMAAQWEGFKAAYNNYGIYDDGQINRAFMAFISVLDMGDETTVDGENVVLLPVAEYNQLLAHEHLIKDALRAFVFQKSARQVAAGRVGGDAMSYKELRDWIFNWSQDEGKTPLESDINDLIWTIQKHAPPLVLSADAPADLDALKRETREYFNAFSEDYEKMMHRHGDAVIDRLMETGRLSGVTKPTTTKEEQEND